MQSCKLWKQTWRFISRFTKRPANSPWRSISVNHRRRAGSSSARGRRKKSNSCRRLCSSTETKASATHRASPFQGAKSVVSAAAPFRPTIEWIRVERHQLIVSPLCADLSMSDDSSLSDVVALDDGEFNSSKYHNFFKNMT